MILFDHLFHSFFLCVHQTLISQFLKDAMDLVLEAMGSRNDSKRVRSGNDVVDASRPLKRPAAKSGGMDGGMDGCKPPSFSVEWTRKQVMCRTGKKGAGESVAMKFEGSVYATVEKAKKWVADKRKELGWD